MDFMQGREIVIVVVAVPVVAHGGALRDLLRVCQGDALASPSSVPRGGKEQLDGVDRLADIAAAGCGDVLQRTPCSALAGDAAPLLQICQRPLHRLLRLRRRDGLEFKHRAAATESRCRHRNTDFPWWRR